MNVTEPATYLGELGLGEATQSRLGQTTQTLTHLEVLRHGHALGQRALRELLNRCRWLKVSCIVIGHHDFAQLIQHF